ncbi:hypothetical protein G3I71_39325, partial [Streptomyces sp. SID12501]|nr:hypothetical protein [Streptomyces sp. SID12501]
MVTGLVQAVPASAAVAVDPLPDTGGSGISFGQDVRANRCEAGFGLHIGGPALKAAAEKALNGTDADLAADLLRPSNIYPSVLDDAVRVDVSGVSDYVAASNASETRWEAANRTYALSYFGDDAVTVNAPEFDADITTFTIGPQLKLYDMFGQDGRSMPGAAAITAAKSLNAAIKGQNPGDDRLADLMLSPSGLSAPYNNTTASDIARYLRQGGFPKQAPVDGSAEYRMEVEALKIAWGSCDSWNPTDPRRVLASVTATAYAEWEQEYAAQAQPRRDIMAAEVTAAAQLHKATDAMIESIAQAWLAEQILLWQKYWAGQSAADPLRPKAAVFTQATTNLASARTRAAAQLTLANTAVTAAGAASAKATNAQTAAYAIADAAKLPRGRGLLYAQQSVQSVKASYAAAQAAAKATQTAVNAAKATVADSKAQFALSQTQAHALNTEFRRAAAQEAAAQAKAAATAAAAQATEAATNATKARTAQTTAETAEQTAKTGAAKAKSERGKAEAARDTAKAEHANATRERGKASDAESRAQADRDAAATARSAAETAGATAYTKLETAEDAEADAYRARDAARNAEVDKQAKLSRASALEAAAAAAAGSAAAGEARTAATEARTAANSATSAATSARANANIASDAAVAARAAATRADG